MKLLLILVLAAPGFAETHRFEPKEFFNTFSASHQPVLRIKPGDHVITYTIDARGVDAAGVQRAPGGNPETGPFFIEGAEPGDTLVRARGELRGQLLEGTGERRRAGWVSGISAAG